MKKDNKEIVGTVSLEEAFEKILPLMSEEDKEILKEAMNSRNPIMISINPKWVTKILSGEKTIELRKDFPKCSFPCDVYIYCTKGPTTAINMRTALFGNPADAIRNGKVVAKFTLNKVEEVKFIMDWTYGGSYTTQNSLYYSDSLKRQSCLNTTEIDNYLNKDNNKRDKVGYAWYIEGLKVFDKPRELKEFGLKRAPQSWCYVWK